MPESFVQDAAELGFPPDWNGGSVTENTWAIRWDGSEYRSTCSAEELEDTILRHLWESDVDRMEVNDQCGSDPESSGPPVDALDSLGTDDEDLLVYSLMFRTAHYGELFFSARFLAQVLERTRLPVFIDCELSGWVIWDPEERVLRVPDLMRGYYCIGHDVPPKVSDPQTHALLSRSLATSDHGRKPLLISAYQIADVVAGRAVPLETPSFIAERDFPNYALAYVSSNGDIQVIPLPRVAKFEMPIATRGQTYIPMRESGFRVKFDYAYLMVSAYVMAVKNVPHDLAHFRVNRELTAFQPALLRSGYKLGERTAGLDAAMELLDLYPYEDSVYLTTGEHPFENSSYCSQNHLGEHWVTTTELYARALRTLSNFGYEVAIEFGEPTVRGAKLDELD